MRHYCTYFDRHYLVRGLALYQSLKRHDGPFTLWVLCFDDWSYDVLTRLAEPDLRPIALADFERDDAALLAVKPTRSKVEYYFTCSPSLPLYVLNAHPEIELLTYLDADLFFYADPTPIFDEMGGGSILIGEHRYPPDLRYMEVHGVYNVGLLAFRNDERARACLQWWRERCLEWCYDRPEDGKYADQKYLDDWPERFPGTVVLQHPGAGLAPWNWKNYALTVTQGRVTVDGLPLLFFHFHGLKIIAPWLYDPVYAGKIYGEMPRGLTRLLYGGYAARLREAAGWARRVSPDVAIEYARLGRGYAWRVFVSKVRRARLQVTSGLK